MQKEETFPCREGCGECCDPVLMKEEELERLKEKAVRDFVILRFDTPWGDMVLPVSLDANFDKLCVFLTDEKRCSIYEDRPRICRDFGVRKAMCPYIRPDGTLRSEEETDWHKRSRGIYYAYAAAIIDPDGEIEAGKSGNDIIRQYLSLLFEQHPVAMYICIFTLGIDFKKAIINRETKGCDVSIPVKCKEKFYSNLKRMGIELPTA